MLASLGGCASAPPYQRPTFYGVDMIRDKQGHGRGEATGQMADAQCRESLSRDAQTFVTRGIMMGIAVGPNDSAIYFDNHYPTCMRALGYAIQTSEAERDQALDFYNKQARGQATP